MKAVFMALHSHLPPVFDLKSSGVFSLLLTAVLTVTWSWQITVRRPVPGTLLVVQMANLLTWLIYTAMVHSCHGIHWSKEAWIPVTSYAVSSGLCLVVGWMARRSQSPVAGH